MPATTPTDTTSSSIPEPWWVYFLRCVDGTLYCGVSNDVERRVDRHGRGQVKYTRGRLPVELVYQEFCADKSAALRREIALKRLSRAAKLDLAELSNVD